MSEEGGSAELIGAEPVDGPGRLRSAWTGSGLVGGAVVLVALFAILASSGPAEKAAPAPTSMPDRTSVPEPTRPSTVQASTVAIDQVEFLPGHGSLRGAIALASFGTPGGPEKVWIVSTGGIRAGGAPLAPGDWPHYALFWEERLVFMNPPYALMLHSDLDQQPQVIGRARYLIAGAEPGVVWTVNDDISRIQKIVLPSRSIEEQIDLPEGVTWVENEVADGFVVMSEGEQRFWSPTSGFSELPLPSDGGVWQSRGDQVVSVSTGPRVWLTDVRDGSQRDVSFDVAGGNVSEVCLSPSAQYLVAVGSTGKAVVVDLEQRSTVLEFSVGQEFDGVAWSASDQLVYIDHTSHVVALDVPSGVPTAVARLHNLSGSPLKLVGSAASC